MKGNSNNPQHSHSNESEFKRKTKVEGFSNFKGLDEYIQSSLDKFKFIEPMPVMYEATGNDVNCIISHKSTIPDLVIWNKTFNKNECFEGANLNEENPFPRFQFFLRVKPAKSGEGKEKKKEKKKKEKQKNKEKVKDKEKRNVKENNCKKNQKQPKEKAQKVKLANLNQIKDELITEKKENIIIGKEENKQSQENFEIANAFNEIKLYDNVIGEKQIKDSNAELLEDNSKNLLSKDNILLRWDLNNLTSDKDKEKQIDNKVTDTNMNFPNFSENNIPNEDNDNNNFQNLTNEYEKMFQNNDVKEDIEQNIQSDYQVNEPITYSQHKSSLAESNNNIISNYQSEIPKSHKKKKEGKSKKNKTFNQHPPPSIQEEQNLYTQNQFTKNNSSKAFFNQQNIGDNFGMPNQQFYPNNNMNINLMMNLYQQQQQQQQQNEILYFLVKKNLEQLGWIVMQINRQFSTFTSILLYDFLYKKKIQNFNISLLVVKETESGFLFNGEQMYIILTSALQRIYQEQQQQMLIEAMKKPKKKKNKKANVLNNNSNTIFPQQQNQITNQNNNTHLQYITNDINFNNYPLPMGNKYINMNFSPFNMDNPEGNEDDDNNNMNENFNDFNNPSFQHNIKNQSQLQDMMMGNNYPFRAEQNQMEQKEDINQYMDNMNFFGNIDNTENIESNDKDF